MVTTLERRDYTEHPVVSVTYRVTEREWDEYVSRHPDASADHLWRWQRIFTDVFGHECRYLAAQREGTICGVLPLVLFRSRLFGRSVISLPFLNYGGVLADDDATAQALVTEAEHVANRFGAKYVELRHIARRFQSLPCRQHKLGFVRILPSTAEELWAGTDRKVRNQVRKAQKEELVVTSGGSEYVEDFYSVFARNMRDLGTPVYSAQLFRTTLEVFPERARIFVVKRNDTVMAAGISIRFRDTVLVPWASSLKQFRPLCPNMLLYWGMLEAAVAGGVRRFDFGRSSPDAGTRHFKVQWGAESAPLHWEYVVQQGAAIPEHGPSGPTFKLAVKMWTHLPLWLANAAGPPIVRSIP